MRLDDAIQRGTRAAQPLATAVAGGALYYVTDELVLERSTGSAWEDISSAKTNVLQRTIGIVMTEFTTGIKGYVEIPFAGTITAARIFADASCSAVVDIWADAYANFPPTVADTITAAAKPTLSTAVKAEDTTLTGWTTAVAAGDIVVFNLDSVTIGAATVVFVQLTVTATG